jgi:hypothetical protein
LLRQEITGATANLNEETEVRVLADGLSADVLLDVLALEVDTLQNRHERERWHGWGIIQNIPFLLLLMTVWKLGQIEGAGGEGKKEKRRRKGVRGKA